MSFRNFQRIRKKHVNNNHKQNINAIYIGSNKLLCKFPDLSSLSASSNYSLIIKSTKYGYLTEKFDPITIYSKPILSQLSNTTFNDNEKQAQLTIIGSNLLSLQPFQF